MRKCVRCQTEMKLGYGLKIDNIAGGIAPIRLSKGIGLFSERKEKVKVAVCPNCGEISIYIEDVEKL